MGFAWFQISPNIAVSELLINAFVCMGYIISAQRPIIFRAGSQKGLPKTPKTTENAPRAKTLQFQPLHTTQKCFFVLSSRQEATPNAMPFHKRPAPESKT